MIQTPRILGIAALLILLSICFVTYIPEESKLILSPTTQTHDLQNSEADTCPASCVNKGQNIKKVAYIESLCGAIWDLKKGNSDENKPEDEKKVGYGTKEEVEEKLEATGGPANYPLGNVTGTLKDVLNETLGFQKVLLVNLPERHDKLDAQIISSSLTGFKFEVIDGIRGKDVSEISLPPTFNLKTINEGVQTIGAWRAELNAVRTIIKERWGSALIMEDDSDWDVHLKYQLLDVARGNRFLTQSDSSSKSEGKDSNNDEPATENSTVQSPYGDNWDIIWLGHCGSRSHPSPRRFIIRNDPTVPNEKDIMFPAGFPTPESQWKEPGTRLMYKSGPGICSWTYAVSFIGAQKLLNAMSIEPYNEGFDQGLGRLCSSGILNCNHIFPPIFGAHAPAGGANRESDITGHKAGGEVREKGRTHNVLWSMRLNIKNILEGKKIEGQWDGVPDLKGQELRREFID